MNIRQHKDNIEIIVGSEKIKAIEMNYEGYFEGDFKGNGIVGMNKNKIIIAFFTPPENGILFDFTGYVKLSNIYYYVDDKERLISGYNQIKEDTWENNSNNFEDGSVEYENLDTKREYNARIKGESSMAYKINGTPQKASPKNVKGKRFAGKKRKQKRIRQKHLRGISSYQHNHNHIYHVDRYGNGYTSNNNGHIHEIIKYVVQDANNHIHEIEVGENG